MAHAIAIAQPRKPAATGRTRRPAAALGAWWRRLPRALRLLITRRRGKPTGAQAVLAAVVLATVWVLFALRGAALTRSPTSADLAPLSAAAQHSVHHPPAGGDDGHVLIAAPASAAAADLIGEYFVPPLIASSLPSAAATRLLGKLARLRESGVRHPRLLILHAQNGLGNRLRALASGLAVARTTKRVPLVVWEADAHLGAQFGDVLEERVALPGSGRLTLEAALYADLVVVDRFPSWPSVASLTGRSFRPYNYMVKDGAGATQGETLYFRPGRPACGRGAMILGILHPGHPACSRSPTISTRQHVYLKTAYVAETHPHAHSGQAAVNAEMRRLRPVQRVLDIVNEHYPSKVRYVFGAHVRSRLIARDGARIDGGCEYTASAEATTDFWRARSQLPEFLNVLHYLLGKYRALHFFVAADDAAQLEKAAKRWPGRVHYIPRECDDRAPECVRYAMADLLCLSRTARIYGSNWSSFTEAAGRLANRRPLLSGVHFGKGRGRDLSASQRAARVWWTARVRVGRALFGWKTSCPKQSR